jgi:dTDP-4-dehydrorhamnose 3,5-epimerase
VGAGMIDGVVVTPLREIETSGGNVFHAIKEGEAGYHGFGEAYFSTIQSGMIKPWKRHNKMTLNLVVPIGMIRFVMFDDRLDSISSHSFAEVTLGNPGHYARLTVPPGIWMAFQGVALETSWLLNVADLLHDPKEADRRTLNEIMYDWSI